MRLRICHRRISRPQNDVPSLIVRWLRPTPLSQVPVVVACRVLGVTTQGYYKWLRSPVSDRDWDDAHLMNKLYDLHAEEPEFGYRSLSDELTVAGHEVSERRVWRLCHTAGISSVITQRKGRYQKAGEPVHDDLVQRDFTAAGPNQLWLTDITEHRTDEGKLYLCAVKDVWDNKIVGYSASHRMKASLAVDALEMAVLHRGRPKNVVVHSDRGSQFRSKKFQNALTRHELKGSMGQVGACADNAAMESFFSLLQKNVLDRERWATRQQLNLAIMHWIEAKYHRKRKQRALGKLTPIEFATAMLNRVVLAA